MILYQVLENNVLTQVFLPIYFRYNQYIWVIAGCYRETQGKLISVLQRL